jgi:hypothetical protein
MTIEDSKNESKPAPFEPKATAPQIETNFVDSAA